MSKSTIVDTSIKLRPSAELLKLLETNKDTISEIPENVANAMKRAGISLPDSKIEIIVDEMAFKQPKLDIDLLGKLCSSSVKEDNINQDIKANTKLKQDSTENVENEVYLRVCDLRWLNTFLAQLRRDHGLDIYLHNLIENCVLELPKNEIIARNPVLEARCQKLREQQENRDYMKMTKNVDATTKHLPEDTIAYQMKAINSQIIAVLQFIFSVVAGFVFGFLGIELIIGNLDFGLRLLLGIMFALIIALAEIYFLAKKLNEYETVVTETKNPITSFGSPVKNKKVHAD